MTYIQYWPYTTIHEPLSYPAVSIVGREPARGPRVNYCHSTALQNGNEYAENCILLTIIYSHVHAGTWSIPEIVYVISVFFLLL